MRRFAEAVGSNVASPLVQSMDVNAIIQEIDFDEVLENIDVNELFERIDVNRVFDRIDVNRVLDRVDVDRHLDRVDFDRHLDRVDLNALIAKSNLEDIISRSTHGVFSGIFNLVRTRMAWTDQSLQRVFQCCCFRCCDISFRGNGPSLCCGLCHKREDVVYYLPPRPGRHPEDSYTAWINPGKLVQREFSRAIQFRTCGALNRIISQGFDQLFIWLTYAMFAAVITLLGNNLTENDKWADETLLSLPFWFNAVMYFSYSFLYYTWQVGCFGKSLGMWILGLLMVSRSGNRISFIKVCGQFFLSPLNFVFFGWLVGFMRRDGKMWSDLIGGVAMVYSYDSSNVVGSHNNPEMAVSLTDFYEIIQQEENRNSFSTMNRSGSKTNSSDIQISSGDIECSVVNGSK